VPALPGCVSQGETLKKTKANIREAIEGYLEGAEENVSAKEGGHIYELTT